MRPIEEIQRAYIEEMLGIQPELIKWWMKVARLQKINDAPPPEVANRWPTAFSGHPRVIEIFRRYFLEIEERNRQMLEKAGKPTPPRDSEDMWGKWDMGDEVDYHAPADILIFEAGELEPNIAKMVAGIVFVPVGLNQYEEPV